MVNQQKWLRQYYQRVGDVAEERGKALQELTEAGFDAEEAREWLDEALTREARIAVRPLGIEGESEIQKTDRAWAALDTAVDLLAQDWPKADSGKPEPIEVALGLIDRDDAIQIRVEGTDEDTVTNYANRMEAGDEFPSLVLFFDYNDSYDWHLWLADGFHRYGALLRTMDYTAPAIVYSGTRQDAKEYAATCNARHGLPLSNGDKRAAVQRLLELHPEWSDREIARRLGVSHPFVGKVRKAKTEASGNDYQMPGERVVQRGDQTYTYTPPERDEGKEKSPSVDPESQQPTSNAPQSTVSPQSPSAPPQPQSTQPNEDPRLSVVIREHLIAGDVEGFLEALSQVELDDYYQPATPSDFYSAINCVFGGGSDAYVDRRQQREAVRCLYDALTGTTQAPKAEAEEAKKSTFTGDICPDCGGRIIHVSSNGRPRNVCMECGAVTNLKETL